MAIKTSISLPDELHWGLKDAAIARRISETAALRLALSEFIENTARLKGSPLVPKSEEVPDVSKIGGYPVTSGDSFSTSAYCADTQQAHDLLEDILRDGPEMFQLAILHTLQAFSGASYLAKTHGFDGYSNTLDESLAELIERSRRTVARARRSLHDPNPAGEGNPQAKEGAAPRAGRKRAS